LNHAVASRPAPRARGAGGQATVEFALVLPLVVALALGVLQLGAVARDQMLTVHAAREAARAASVDPDPARARRAAEGVLPGSHVDVGPRPGIGQAIAVTVTYRARTSVPVVGAFVPDVTLHARAVMAVER